MSRDRHAAPAHAEQDLLYDPEVATPTHAERARTLVAAQSTGALSTLSIEPPGGFPYGSFVTYGLAGGSPVFLISELAEHTRNLHRDPRASLLVVEPGQGDPLARGRVSLVGRVTPLATSAVEAAREAYLAAHPTAGYYVDFRDFKFWGLAVEAVRYIGGYGRMSWVAAADWSAAEPDPIAPHAAGILRHMNEDHAAVMVEYCRAFSRATDASAATMTVVDRYGFEMSVSTAAGPRPVRLAFSQPISTPEEARSELVVMARRARQGA